MREISKANVSSRCGEMIGIHTRSWELECPCGLRSFEGTSSSIYRIELELAIARKNNRKYLGI